jgi:hypothetical protein
VVATSLTDGRERWFTYGPVAEAVLASTAIPAIFPPIEIDGDRFIDGGVVNNVPIRRAIDCRRHPDRGAALYPPVYTPVPRRPVEAMLNALLISIHARFAREMAQLPEGVEVILCSGSEGGTRDFDDFSTTQALIAQGREGGIRGGPALRPRAARRRPRWGRRRAGPRRWGPDRIGPIGPRTGPGPGHRILGPAETERWPRADGDSVGRGLVHRVVSHPDPGT